MPNEIRILVVDDDEIINYVLVKELKNNSRLDIQSSLSSREALQMIYSKNYQIIVVDLMMPDMDGFELIKLIKSYNDLVQIVVITGYNSTTKILDFLRLGVSDFFIKPFDFAEVSESVNRIVDKIERWNQQLAKALK